MPKGERMFEEFWKAYPRKIAKGSARKAYSKALRIADHQKIMDGLADSCQHWLGKDTQFIPHASTWLNQERWEDEYETAKATSVLELVVNNG